MTEQAYLTSNVLLVEDDEIASFISSNVLKSVGIVNISAVENGLQACSFLENNCPDYIFLDLSMPVMDGFEFLEAYQKNGYCANHTKIIILTSSIRPSDKEKASEYNNIIGYIEKPLDAEKVKNVLANM
ncbi:response regulator [Chondrinema litorale]|uniref:response regulator n=1 Tax=Chondrinema litorale TaxID=2994555 RepID=UPI002542B740|nr:response regulator [Chondrinema litorale]UZR97817.1 response regulator [Chondrinema litorale]